jgi:hypothetical protein
MKTQRNVILFSKMLHDQRNVIIDNNHVTVIDMITTRFDKLEHKRTDYIHLSVQEHAKQPQYNMSYNYYENLGLYVATTNVQIGLFII